MRSTRCKAFLLAGLLVAGPALADPPPAVAIHKGTPAPDDGVFLSTQAALDTAKRCAQAEADREKYRQQVADGPMPSGSLLLGAGVVGLVLGVVLGGIAVAVAKR